MSQESRHRVSKRAKRTWDRLGDWYGARFGEQYGPSPSEDWCKLIDRTDDERLESALSSCRHSSPIHPPTLGQLESAIPKRDLSPGSRESLPEKLCKFALEKIGRTLCEHQVAMRWNWFGSGFVAGEVPTWKGVQIPPCDACAKESRRVLASELLTAGAPVG